MLFSRVNENGEFGHILTYLAHIFGGLILKLIHEIFFEDPPIFYSYMTIFQNK